MFEPISGDPFPQILRFLRWEDQKFLKGVINERSLNDEGALFLLWIKPMILTRNTSGFFFFKKILMWTKKLGLSILARKVHHKDGLNEERKNVALRLRIHHAAIHVEEISDDQQLGRKEGIHADTRGSEAIQGL